MNCNMTPGGGMNLVSPGRNIRSKQAHSENNAKDASSHLALAFAFRLQHGKLFLPKLVLLDVERMTVGSGFL